MKAVLAVEGLARPGDVEEGEAVGVVEEEVEGEGEAEEVLIDLLTALPEEEEAGNQLGTAKRVYKAVEVATPTLVQRIGQWWLFTQKLPKMNIG